MNQEEFDELMLHELQPQPSTSSGVTSTGHLYMAPVPGYETLWQNDPNPSTSILHASEYQMPQEDVNRRETQALSQPGLPQMLNPAPFDNVWEKEKKAFKNDPKPSTSKVHMSEYQMPQEDVNRRETQAPSQRALPQILNPALIDNVGREKEKKAFKKAHNEIEQRRREKMSTYLQEIWSLLPKCNEMPRKLDKLTILRMAVQHVKEIKNGTTSYPKSQDKPAFLSEQEVNGAILQALSATDAFLFVISCDTSRILFLSESVSRIINYKRKDLVGQSWFDILHPKDVAKVKDQLAYLHLGSKETLIDAKSKLPIKTTMEQETIPLTSGSRRSFFCRIKMNTQFEENQTTRTMDHLSLEKQYCIVQCSGYIKRWIPSHSQESSKVFGPADEYSDESGAPCLVAVALRRTALPTNEPPLDSRPSTSLQKIEKALFQSRHSIEGNFTFVDQRCCLILGYLPQELVGTNMYQYIHLEDVPSLVDTHKNVLLTCGTYKTSVYRFKRKDGRFVKLQSDWKAIKNTWTTDIEHLFAKNTVIGTIPHENKAENQTNPDANLDDTACKILPSQEDFSMIGARIVAEITEIQRRESEGGAPDLNPLQVTISDVSSFVSQQNNLTEPPIIPQPVMESEEIIYGLRINGTLPIFGQEPADGNDEAAMSAIMNLLEADAGLGESPDFNGLPWPLP